MPTSLLIALNLHYLRPQITGGGETYAVQLVHALAKIDGRNQYVLYCNRRCNQLELPCQDNFQAVTSPVTASVRPLRYAWEQLVLPADLRRRQPNLVHSMGYVSPVLAPVRQVVTIPDANWTDLDVMSATKRRALGFFVRRSAAAAEVILTGTLAAAQRLEQQLPRDRGQIAVIPLGADHLPPPDRAAVTRPGNPYILALSGSVPHKNIPRLVEAFALIAGRIPHSLVIAGNVPSSVSVGMRTAALNQRVQWTGYVSDERLSTLYAGADLFVFPSWHEGFGLPLLEAQRFGTPVAASDIPALAEIANGCAELFDPFSTESMAAAILNVVGSPERRRELAQAASGNAARFTWEATARATLSVYEEVAAAARKRHPLRR